MTRFTALPPCLEGRAKGTIIKDPPYAGGPTVRVPDQDAINGRTIGMMIEPAGDDPRSLEEYLSLHRITDDLRAYFIGIEIGRRVGSATSFLHWPSDGDSAVMKHHHAGENECYGVDWFHMCFLQCELSARVRLLTGILIAQMASVFDGQPLGIVSVRKHLLRRDDALRR